MNSSKVKFAISTIVSTLMAMVIFVGVLTISQKNHHTFDLTKNKRFTLSQQSVSVVQQLEKPVEAIAFLMQLDADGMDRARNLLEQYQKAAPDKFSFKIVDPKRDPLTAQKYDVHMPGVVVLACGEQRGRSQSTDEEDITNALLKLNETATKKVYFLTGHGEISAYSSTSEQNLEGLPNMSKFRGDMPNDGFEGENLNLITAKSVPADASIIVIPGPTKALMPAEQKALENWIDKGGRVLLTLELETGKAFDWLLKKYGFDSPEEVIIDEMAQMAGAEPVFALALQYDQECGLARNFAVHTLFKLARPVMPAAKSPSGAQMYAVASTGPNAFTLSISEIMAKKQVKISKNNAARVGSFSLAAAGIYPVAGADAKKSEAKDKDASKDAKNETKEGKEDRPQTRIVVIGDSEFFCNELYAAAGNRDFALNVLNWLSASEDRITIRTKDTTSSEPIMLTWKQSRAIKALLIIAIPLALLLTGVTIYRRRR